MARPALRASRCVAGSLVFVVAVLAVTACGPRRATPQDPEASITVFAAASLTAAFQEIGEAYTAEHPKTEVTFSFGASSELVAQINQGAPADVFASADEKNMGKLEPGSIGEPVVFATNHLELIVAPGNPKHIEGVSDLARTDVVFVSASPEVPIGRYAQQVLDAAGVVATPKSLEASVKGIVSKVVLGEADAGIVYVTDVIAAGDKAQGIEIPSAANVLAKYPIAVPASAKHSDSAAAFVAFVRSPQGQRILAKYGFGAP